MKLSELAKKPQLTEITIDDPQLVEEYGESINFYILDRLPIDTFTKLASIKTDNVSDMFVVMRDLILDENGDPVMIEDKVLPTDILTACVTKVSEYLGKSVGSAS